MMSVAMRPAPADVVVDSGWNGLQSGGMTISANDADDGQTCAIGFNLAQPLLVTGVSAYINVSSDWAHVQSDFEWMICTDLGNVPDTSSSVLTAAAQTQAAASGWNAQWVTTDVSAQNVVLSAGTDYWLAIIPAYGARFSIKQGDTTLSNAYEFAEAIYANDPAWWNVTDIANYDYSFRVEGTVVPEPSCLALLGILGLAVVRRKWRAD